MNIIKISQKRNCNKCKASSLKGCALGFSVSGFISQAPVINLMKPLEECPKPLNNSDYLYCLSNSWTRGDK